MTAAPKRRKKCVRETQTGNLRSACGHNAFASKRIGPKQSRVGAWWCPNIEYTPDRNPGDLSKLAQSAKMLYLTESLNFV